MSVDATTLFATLARDRAEWLAQGLFSHALQHDAGVRKRVLQIVLPSRARALASVVPKVRDERPTGKWRADVVAWWPGQPKACFELKLTAGLTKRQLQELGRRCAALVHPHGSPPARLGNVPRLTWKELAQAATDPVLQSLLAQVDASASWWLGQLDAATLEAEFTGFLRKRAWPRMYRFLATVDAVLADHLGSAYRPSVGWAMSRRKALSYYGFAFRVGKQPEREWYFLGAYREGGEVGIALTHQRSGKDLLVSGFPSDARQLARAIAAQTGEWMEDAA
jgi:hypothetical protein